MNRDMKIVVAVAGVIVVVVLAFFGVNYGSQSSCPKPPPDVAASPEQPLTENMMPASVRFISVGSLDQLVQIARSSQQGEPGITINRGYIERLGYTAYYYSAGVPDYTGTVVIYVYKC